MSFPLLERHDPFSQLRNGLGVLAQDQKEWAGIPMPIDGHRLVIEPKYPRARELSLIGNTQEEAAPPWIVPRASFWSTHRRCEVLIWEDRSAVTPQRHGKVCWGLIPGMHHLQMDLHTLDVSVAWGIEQESRAINLLAKHLSHYAFTRYLLTGMFVETSKVSGVSYVFRRLRPTVALGGSYQGQIRILCALCMHPIAYYDATFAGVMCPTDDVIAHLMLMRADEHLYWRRCNQHPAFRPQAGL